MPEPWETFQKDLETKKKKDFADFSDAKAKAEKKKLITKLDAAWKKEDDLRDKIIEAQEEDGSWKQKMSHGPVNQHMATCLATMLLEVYYRFLPGTAEE